ncbi:MAG TPA: protein translocase subunit SecF [Candidatus Saccharimonadales bacterium]|nr:protein translocase subunit SecF [Candidatus Saccharimonadales bacterium]
MNIIKYKNWYFGLSLLVIIPGLISLFLFGLKPAIDFTGGSNITYSSSRTITASDTRNVVSDFQKVQVNVVGTNANSTTLTIKTPPIDQATHNKVTAIISQSQPTLKETEFVTVGPTVGAETTKNALLGIVVASILIVLYIAWTFRGVPKPASSWKFGVTAIVALLHDALVLLGIFSLLGHFFGVEVDSLFVTAVLTVIGFSVHDTIVVFDRIRENLRRNPQGDFATTVNNSILQTLGRSLNTSLTVILVLFTLLLFGGESTFWFVVALLVGIVSGTYSSIFNASPLLVLWQEISGKKK